MRSDENFRDCCCQSLHLARQRHGLRPRLAYVPVLLALTSVFFLTGCQAPPKPTPATDPWIISHTELIDPVHTRELSLYRYDLEQGGSALRDNRTAHVLYDTHYQGERGVGIYGESLAESISRIEREHLDKRRLDQIEELRKKSQAQLRSNCLDSKDMNCPVDSKTLKVSKDKSIYAKDRSIYKDKSIYSKTKRKN